MQVLDQQWKAHLLGLDQLRQGIGLRAYAQRDPLNEYKRESFTMFEDMLETVRVTACRFIMLIEIETKQAPILADTKVLAQTPTKESNEITGAPV